MMSERPVKKRAVNLFVDAELLDEASRMRINVSDALERRLRSIVRAEHEAITSINSFIDRHGLLADRLRVRTASHNRGCRC